MADETKPQGPLDWTEAYARLARLAHATEAAEALAPEQAAAVLDARARRLATPQAPAPEGTLLEVVRFHDGAQGYALESRYVHEVLRAPELTPLPGAPERLRGLTLLRGEVLPLVELAPLLGRPVTGTLALVLVVGAGRPELGISAASVEEVAPLAPGALLPPPEALGEAGALVSGIDREGLILLEGGALLGDSRLVFDLADERST
jgi:purine-binding chemotaxis protein CheW